MNNLRGLSELKISPVEGSKVEYDKNNLDLDEVRIKELKIYSYENGSEYVLFENVVIDYTEQGVLKVNTSRLNADFYNSAVMCKEKIGRASCRERVSSPV